MMMGITYQIWEHLAIPIIIGMLYKDYELSTDRVRYHKKIKDNVWWDWFTRMCAAVSAGVLNHHFYGESIITSMFLVATVFYLLFDYQYAIMIGQRWYFLGTTKKHDRFLGKYNKWLVLSGKTILFGLSIILTLIRF